MDTEWPKLAVLASIAPRCYFSRAFLFLPRANGTLVLFLLMARHIMGVAVSTEVSS